MGTTFCKKKYIRATESNTFFNKGDVFEVISECEEFYKVKIPDYLLPTEFYKYRFETIPSNEEETPMTLKIEVGKFYKTRGGLKAGPMERPRNTASYSYDFVGAVSNGTIKIYQSDGRNGSNIIGFFPEHNLVEEWVDPKITESDRPVVFIDFKVGDIIMSPMKPSNNRKEVLLVTEKYYFLRDLVTLSEHSIKKHMIDGVWSLAPPPPKVTKKFKIVRADGTTFDVYSWLHEDAVATKTVKDILQHYSSAYGVLEITVTDDNGKLTMESRIIPA